MLIYLGIKVGTDGSRLDKMEDFSFEEDDKYWILGAGFYNNPDDPAIFVPKRVGVGYTINICLLYTSDAADEAYDV